jgi:hypothetical protein
MRVFILKVNNCHKWQVTPYKIGITAKSCK